MSAALPSLLQETRPAASFSPVSFCKWRPQQSDSVSSPEVSRDECRSCQLSMGHFFCPLRCLLYSTSSAWKPRRYYKQPSQMIYVGSTSVSVARGECDRHAVLRRLEHTPCTQAELSLRYWKSKQSFHNYTLFKLSSHENYRQAWVPEDQLIAKWQPRLNYPFVTRFLQ